MGGRTDGPFCPTTLGAAKQLGLMNWCGPSPDLGLHVMSGLSWTSVVPRSEALLMLNLVPGIVAPLRLKLKFWLELFPVRLAPLSSCVMPESCQPFKTWPASLLLAGLGKSMW